MSSVRAYASKGCLFASCRPTLGDQLTSQCELAYGLVCNQLCYKAFTTISAGKKGLFSTTSILFMLGCWGPQHGNKALPLLRTVWMGGAAPIVATKDTTRRRPRRTSGCMVRSSVCFHIMPASSSCKQTARLISNGSPGNRDKGYWYKPLM